MNYLCFTALPSPPAAAAAAALPPPPLPEVAGPQEFRPSPPTPFRTTCSSHPTSLSRYPSSNSTTNRGLFTPLRRHRLQISCPQVSNHNLAVRPRREVRVQYSVGTAPPVYRHLGCPALITHHISLPVCMSLHLCVFTDAKTHRRTDICMSRYTRIRAHTHTDTS